MKNLPKKYIGAMLEAQEQINTPQKENKELREDKYELLQSLTVLNEENTKLKERVKELEHFNKCLIIEVRSWDNYTNKEIQDVKQLLKNNIKD